VINHEFNSIRGSFRRVEPVRVAAAGYDCEGKERTGVGGGERGDVHFEPSARARCKGFDCRPLGRPVVEGERLLRPGIDSDRLNILEMARRIGYEHSYLGA